MKYVTLEVMNFASSLLYDIGKGLRDVFCGTQHTLFDYPSCFFPYISLVTIIIYMFKYEFAVIFVASTKRQIFISWVSLEK